ncbi:hypothetical protein [Rhizobium leguminosarum]|uniref:hypothetical protein n=1 Tax=Rhizobium leguminosarum TaxID=384 RepID=UPI003F9B42EF
MSPTPHPNRFIEHSDVRHEHRKSIHALPRGRQNALFEKEYAVLSEDPLGRDRRETLWATVHDTNAAFTSFEGAIIDALDDPYALPKDSVFYDDGLPRVFYLNFGSDFGLEVNGEPNRFVEGAYFVKCMIGGESGYRYVVVTDTLGDVDVDRMTIGESILEQTRVAVGFVQPGQSLDDSIDKVAGDPRICNAVKEQGVRDALRDGVALTASLSLDQGKAMSASNPASMGMMLSYR